MLRHYGTLCYRQAAFLHASGFPQRAGEQTQDILSAACARFNELGDGVCRLGPAHGRISILALCSPPYGLFFIAVL